MLPLFKVIIVWFKAISKPLTSVIKEYVRHNFTRFEPFFILIELLIKTTMDSTTGKQKGCKKTIVKGSKAEVKQKEEVKKKGIRFKLISLEEWSLKFN